MKQATPTKYEQMGIAALLPGMTFAVELIQKQLDEMRAQLTGIVFGAAEEKRKPGRPKGSQGKAGGGWSDDPEERSREMKRRQAVRYGKVQPKVQQAAKPNHRQRALWASYTPAQRKKRIAAALAGKAAAQAAKAKHVNGAAA